MSQPIIVKNPRITVEKRPGKNYIKTPLSEYNDWDTAEGIQRFGGVWYKNDKKAVASIIVEKIFNDRLFNKECLAVSKGIAVGKDVSWSDKVQYVKESGKESSYFDSTQHINKIDINALFGAMGNRFFHLYELNNARNITLSGQHLIRYLANNFDNFFRNEFWKNPKYWKEINPKNGVTNPIVKIIETDSVTGDTLINVNNKDIKIEDLFELSDSKWNIGNNMYGNLQGFSTQSINTETGEIETKEITYVMKHEVEKELFEIEVNGNIVRVTEDHCIMVKRNSKIIEVKPREILETDKLLYIERGIK